MPRLQLVDSSAAHFASFTFGAVVYSIGNILYRRSLETLKEEYVHAFDATIWGVWTYAPTNTCVVCTFNLNDRAHRQWESDGGAWVENTAGIMSNGTRRIHHHAGYSIHLDGNAMWLVNARTDKRLHRLFDNAQIAAHSV